MKNNRHQRYLFLIPLALGVYLFSRLVSLIFGVNLTLEHGLFLLIVLATIVFQIDSRFNLISGLIVLSLSPFFLILKNEPWADRSAAFAFLLLAIGTLQRVWYQFFVPNRSSGGTGGEGV